jgi:hypothetical protein
MPLALITGNRHHLGPAAATLGRAGFDVMTWAVGSMPPAGGPFDCYVQLPCAQTGAGATGNRRVPDDLICRVDALAAMADRLTPTASILLAVEESDSTAAMRRDLLAPDLLAAVALALLEDLGRSASRLAVVPAADLCRRSPSAGAVAASVEALVPPAGQWEMPTPPLVSAP